MELEGNKKWIVVVLIVVGAIIAFDFSTAPEGGPVVSELEKSLEKDGTYLLNGEKKRCYWIRPSSNGTHYLTEIKEYNEDDKCSGQLLNVKKVVTDIPVNTRGSGCFCGDCKIRTETKGKYIMIYMEGCS